MCPLAIKIALHYFTSAEDYSVNNVMADAQREILSNFVSEGMLIYVPNEFDMEYSPTEKLNVYCQYLVDTPSPVTAYNIVRGES